MSNDPLRAPTPEQLLGKLKALMARSERDRKFGPAACRIACLAAITGYVADVESRLSDAQREIKFKDELIWTSRTSALYEATVAAEKRAEAAEQQLTEAQRTLKSGEASDGYHTFNELYDYRKAFNALLFNEWAALGVYDVHKSKRHSDGEPCFGAGWFIVMAQTMEGQISNHYKLEDWNLFQLPERECAAEYDGHTPAIALERMLRLAQQARERGKA